MKKPRASLALEILVVVFAALLHGAQCQSSEGSSGGGGGANLTVIGTVFCDACSSSSFSKHSYFLPGTLRLCQLHCKLLSYLAPMPA